MPARARPPFRYRSLLKALTPIVALYLAWRAWQDGGWRFLQQRAGYAYPDSRPRYWIHAASVGEVLTVMPLVEALVKHAGDATLLLTTNTPTGARMVVQRAPAAVVHAYLPVDWPGATQRFLNHVKPAAGWIVETEIWPWLYARCRSENIPLGIVNARLSDKTFKQREGFLADTYADALTGVQVLARTDEDASRFRAMGARQVCTVGNLKFVDNRRASTPQRLCDRPYTLLASTHDDEELQFARAWLAQSSEGLLVIVPRHPHRGAGIAQQLQQQLSTEASAGCRLRSTGETPGPGDRLYLADTLGELQDWYAFADAVAVAGSWVPVGGHNVLEAARCEKPVIVGPYMHNFSDVLALMLEQDALVQADTPADAVDVLLRCRSDPHWAAALAGRAARAGEQATRVLDDYLAAVTPSA